MNDNRIYGLLAEFKELKELLHAAKSVREEGFTDFDCHTPFPVHGLDDAMGLKRSVVGYIVGIGCFLGASGGLLIQWWSSTIAYPIVISGKPFFSWQAYMIITFVLMILGGSFAALFGMFHLNKMPTFHHALFNSDNFKKATDDGFFLSIEYKDPLLELDETKELLESLGGINIEEVIE